MKKIVSAILVFAVCSLTWVCAAEVCAMEAPAVEAGQPCHDTLQEPAKGAMLLSDCLDVDFFAPLQAQDNPDQERPVPVARGFVFSADLQPARRVRGPPSQVRRISLKPSLILTTGRFRL